MSRRQGKYQVYGKSAPSYLLHDFWNVHHTWFHRNVEGNYKFRISFKIYLRSLYFILMKLF